MAPAVLAVPALRARDAAPLFTTLLQLGLS